MSTPKQLTSQLADALIAGDQDAVISIMAQVIAYIADDESDEDDTSLTKAARDGRPSTPPSSYLLPYSMLQVYPHERVVRRVDPANFTTVIRKELAPGVTALLGDGEIIESIRFDADKFTETEANAWIAKMEPGVNSVHVNTAGDQVSDKVCDICGKSPCECSNDNFIITKAGEEKRLAYGVVAVPDVVDSQGDVMTADTIEKMAHAYLTNSRSFDLQHLIDLSSDKAEIVESYVAPCDFVLGSKLVKAGSWIAVTHFLDESLWSMVKSQQIKAYSIRGYGTRIPQTSQ